MTTAGFTPGQVAAFVSVGNMEVPKSFTGMTINGRSMGSWYGMYIATPAWKEFMNNYLNSAGIPPDNNYGNPAPQYMSAPAAAPRTQQSTPQRR
jgi:hypothetical protein